MERLHFIEPSGSRNRTNAKIKKASDKLENKGRKVIEEFQTTSGVVILKTIDKNERIKTDGNN